MATRKTAGAYMSRFRPKIKPRRKPNAIAPTFKVTGNPGTAARMPENIDLDISAVLEGRMSCEEAADLLEKELLEVLSGKLTTSEILGETEVTGSRTGLNL